MKKILEHLSAGKFIILTDDESRENEGDLVCAAQFIDAEKVNFLLTHARGLICLPMIKSHAQRLGFHPMVRDNTTSRKTNFTISIEAAEGVSTGISAQDRAATILEVVKEGVQASDFVSPGHIFPLVAQEHGVLARDGHTEGSVDLMILAGLKPAAVICEIMNEDGTMARRDDLEKFSQQYDIPIVSIAELKQHRLSRECWVREEASSQLPVEEGGEFKIRVFRDLLTEQEIVVLQKGQLTKQPLVRLHSSCFTGDVLGSLRCDCKSQLHNSMQYINQHGGLLMYLPQEGRGIGLANKIKAYALQEQGMDTVEANLALGFAADQRDYYQAAHILKALHVDKIKLITNNPKKIENITRYGVEVVERVAAIGECQHHNAHYLAVKKEKMQHY